MNDGIERAKRVVEGCGIGKQEDKGVGVKASAGRRRNDNRLAQSPSGAWRCVRSALKKLEPERPSSSQTEHTKVDDRNNLAPFAAHGELTWTERGKRREATERRGRGVNSIAIYSSIAGTNRG